MCAVNACVPSTCRPHTVVACTLLLAALIGPAAAQVPDNPLRAKLDELNVRVRTEHYALAGTVTDKVFGEYAQILEYIYAEYTKGFTEVLEGSEGTTSESPKTKPKKNAHTKKGRSQPAPAADDTNDGQRFKVLVFATEDDYHEFGRAFITGGTEHTGGMFIPSLGVLLILDRGNPDDTRRVLFHEAFHQFMHRYIKVPPMWLNEGFAVYFEDARPTPKGLNYSQPRPTQWQLVRKAISKGEAIPLWDVLSAGHEEFYDTTPVKLSGFEGIRRSHLYYAESYTLIHTLMNDASAIPRLRDYIRELAKDNGRNTTKITREFFGPEICTHMTQYWVQHIESRPETR